MSRYFFIILLTAFLGCQSNQEKFIIPAEKLLEILEDVHIAEAALTGLGQLRKDSAARVYYDQIFEIHGVTEADFNHDYNLLKSQPKQMAKAYDILAKKMEE